MPEAPDRRTIVVRGGTALLPDGPQRCDLLLVDGRIGAIAPVVAPGRDDTVIDAGGLLVLPGLVDAHVHLQEPGRTEWEGWATGSSAAAAGGVTTVVDMPIDSYPPTTTAEAVRAKVAAARASSVVDFALWGGLTPLDLGSLDEMATAGVVGYKCFLSPTGWDDFPPADAETLDAGFAAAARLGLPVAVHAEDPASFDLRPGLAPSAARPERSEVVAVRQACEAARRHHARVHIVHVSSAAAVREARRYDLATTETCPHYLLLEESELGIDSALTTCCPPIRDTANRDTLWQLLTGDAIDWIASDHSPCTPALKAGPSPFAGIAGLQATLPLLLAADRLDVRAIVELMTAAADSLRLAGKGRLAVGMDADVVLFDPDWSGTLTAEELRIRNPRLSPFVGRELRGRVIRTLVRGKTAFDLDGGEVTARGDHLRPGERAGTG